MVTLKKLFVVLLVFRVAASLRAGDFSAAASATNQLGVELHRKLATGNENLCVSPYSIQSALAMAWAGADGDTRLEMARVLHFPPEGETSHVSFAALRQSLDQMTRATQKIADDSRKKGGPSEPITLAVANRLFGQKGYDFRESFRSIVQRYYGAPFEPTDFHANPDSARRHINKWVAEQTRDRIQDLIPGGGLNEMTRLVLANAIYIKAPWASEFTEGLTKPKPFHVHGAATVDVSTMNDRSQFGYAKRDGFTVVTLPYAGGDLQFVILLPNEVNGLAGLEEKLDAALLAGCAKIERREVDLSLPKFRMEPPTIPLAAALRALGMRSAFDNPHGSANFERIASRKPDDYLYISEVFHKTFIAVDEKGTEAAAATAVTMYATSAAVRQPEPIKVAVDHPFLYAIQHMPSGTCLFLGRVTDPR